jgi:iron complex outermembrane receptor protein
VPGLKVKLDENGLPHFTFPAAWDPNNASSYTRAEMQFRPTESESSEDQLKLDLRYRTSIPFITKVWVGGQGRKSRMFQYNGGGYLINNGSNLASTADDLDVQSANVTHVLNWDPLYTGTGQRPAVVQSFINGNNSESWISSSQMQQLITAIRGTSPAFLSGADIAGFPNNWMAPSYQAAVPFYDTSKFNHDLVRMAMGRDGKLYPQVPGYDTEERIRSAYLRLDFEQELFGLTIDGNFGLRYTGTETKSTGLQQYRRRVERSAGSATFDDRILTNAISTVEQKYHDYLPSFNAATWLVPDKLVVRIGWGKVMSRPLIDRMHRTSTASPAAAVRSSAATAPDDCTAGNPDLKPFRATNKDLSRRVVSERPTASCRWRSSEGYPAPRSCQNVTIGNVDVYFRRRHAVGRDHHGQQRGRHDQGLELAGRTALTILPGC